MTGQAERLWCSDTIGAETPFEGWARRIDGRDAAGATA